MSQLELRHLSAVCAVAETGSLTKAAVTLGVTQPALSAQIRSVEGIVGGRLFERSSYGSTPTELGGYVAARAGLVLDQLTDLVEGSRKRAAESAAA